MSRAYEILAYVVAKRRPVGLAELVRNIEPDSDDRVNTVKRFAAQLCQLTSTGKLKRHGKPRAYTYTSTPKSLLDGRRVTAAGKPRDKTARSRADRARPHPAPPVKAMPVAKPKAPRKVTDHQRFAFPSTPGKTHAPGEPETVAEFLARGGLIQKLKPGESSSPLYESVRALNERTMRQRLRDADNAPDYDLDDDDETAAATA